jgi:hypothetical protein
MKNIILDQENASPTTHMSGRQLGVVFASFMVLHSLVMYVANSFFPSQVVLGNHFFSPVMGLIYAMLPFTVMMVGAIPVIEHLGEMMKRTISNTEWMVGYFFLNTIGIWVLGRFAEWIGLGIDSWLVAVALSVVITMIQGMVVGVVMKKAK